MIQKQRLRRNVIYPKEMPAETRGNSRAKVPLKHRRWRQGSDRSSAPGPCFVVVGKQRFQAAEAREERGRSGIGGAQMSGDSGQPLPSTLL